MNNCSLFPFLATDVTIAGNTGPFRFSHNPSYVVEFGWSSPDAIPLAENQ